jgi:hypothetical protein
VSSPPAEFQEISESEAKEGDVVVFGTSHMGINLDANKVYSSQSIGEEPGPTIGQKKMVPREKEILSLDKKMIR